MSDVKTPEKTEFPFIPPPAPPAPPPPPPPKKPGREPEFAVISTFLACLSFTLIIVAACTPWDGTKFFSTAGAIVSVGGLVTSSITYFGAFEK